MLKKLCFSAPRKTSFCSGSRTAYKNYKNHFGIIHGDTKMTKTKTSKPAKKAARKTVKVIKKKAEPKKRVKKIKTKFVETDFDVTKHILVPKHTLLIDKEKEKLFDKYKITIKELPKIMLTDPAIKHLKAKIGDVIKIERNSSTSGKSIFYRGVINE